MKTADAAEILRARAEAALEEVVTFCLAYDRGRCFPQPQWPRELVRAYLAFHIRQKTACFVRHGEGEQESSSRARGDGDGGGVQTRGPLMAVGVAWQVREEFVRGKEFARAPWLFHQDDADGNCLFIDNLIATDRAGWGVLLSELQFRWPNWRRLKLFAKRRGVVVEYRPERIFARVEAISMEGTF